jgi:hypothetical protein
VRINHSLPASADYLGTLDLLDRHGYSLITIETDKIEKIDTGLSCMSPRWFQRERNCGYREAVFALGSFRPQISSGIYGKIDK